MVTLFWGLAMKALLQNKLVRWVLAPIAVLWAVGWAYFQYEYPTCNFRYKLTAEVMTPEGLKTGSSVIEVSYSHSADWGGGPKEAIKIKGDSIYVDLGAGKNLVFPLYAYETRRPQSVYHKDGQHFTGTGPFPLSYLPIVAFGIDYVFAHEKEFCSDLHMQGDKTAEVAIQYAPVAISFTDTNDLGTFTEVDPNRMDLLFGAGFSFIKIFVQATSDKINTSIEKSLHFVRDDGWHTENGIWRSGASLHFDQPSYIMLREEQ